MIEKIVNLDHISLIDFLGVENKNIDSLAEAFPKSKIVSRGNEILIKGSPAEIIQIGDVLDALVLHYHQYGRVTVENVNQLVSLEKKLFPSEEQGIENGIIVYGTKGTRSSQKRKTNTIWWIW